MPVDTYLEALVDKRGELATWQASGAFPAAHAALLGMLAATCPPGTALCDLGTGLGLLAEAARQALGSVVVGVDARAARIEAGTQAGLLDMYEMRVDETTIDTFAGLLAARHIHGIVARRTLSVILGWKKPAAPGRSLAWARWFTEAVQDAGVRYLWTEGLGPQERGWSFDCVATEVHVLEQVGWVCRQVDDRVAFLEAVDR